MLVRQHIADLAGRRLVILPELPKGRLSTSRLKRLTGGDRISTHREFEHAFEFTPTHTFFVSTNDKPEVQESSPAVWDRIRLIPFSHTFTSDDRLPLQTVRAKVDAEAAGILAWCIQGAVDYLREGLGGEPECVRASTSQYQEEEDSIGRFLAERTIRDAWTRTSDLYKSYRDWCGEQGVTPESQVQMGRELAQRALEPRKGARGTRGFRGLRLESTLA